MSIKGIENIKKALEKYKGSGQRKFFSLQDDGDAANVRFLNGDENDLNIYVVHRVKLGDRDRYVQCTQDDSCPLCRAGNPALLRMFLFLIDRRDGEVKMWERGRAFIPEILGFIHRYGALNNRDYEIVRHGKAKSTDTKYQLFPADKSPEPNLPQMPEIAGPDKFILVKSLEEMKAIADGTYVHQPQPRNNGRAADNVEDVF